MTGHAFSSAPDQGPCWRHGLGVIEVKWKEVFTSQMKTDSGDFSMV